MGYIYMVYANKDTEALYIELQGAMLINIVECRYQE